MGQHQQIMLMLELLVVSMIVLFPVLGVLSGAGECRMRTLECYDCDSRYHNNCYHIDKNLTAPKPNKRECKGCCVKFYHKFPELTYIQRSCTEDIIINYFMVDHVCMSEGKGRGKMCFCEEPLCNRVSRRSYSGFGLPVLLTISLIFSWTHIT